MMLDRGELLDWFSSPEIWIEAILAFIGFSICTIHTLTADHPFLPRALFKDRNFATSLLFGFLLGVLIFATMALLPQLAQNLLGYPVLTTGLTMVPRGFGTLIAMFVVGRMVGRMDSRLILAIGFSLSAFAMWQMSHFALNMTPMAMVTAGFIQGVGTGMLFVPLTTVAFSTLDPACRPDGASLYTLIRNIGAAVGISAMQALQIGKTATLHSNLAEKILPGSPSLVGTGIDLATTPGLASINAEVTRQAQMVAYINVFHLMTLLCLAAMPLLFLLRAPPRQPAKEVHLAVE